MVAMFYTIFVHISPTTSAAAWQRSEEGGRAARTRPKKKICRLHSLTAGLSNLTSSGQMAETQQGRKQEEAS
ncbi:Protein of unknown function [Gryllus bimaculatus]|nr:Protein of unknown function [Gryllus bimaculatus]